MIFIYTTSCIKFLQTQDGGKLVISNAFISLSKILLMFLTPDDISVKLHHLGECTLFDNLLVVKAILLYFILKFYVIPFFIFIIFLILPSKVGGEVYYNGHGLEEFVPQKTSAYISQNDLHIPEMTVRETLDFSARCQGIGSRAGKESLDSYGFDVKICQSKFSV